MTNFKVKEHGNGGAIEVTPINPETNEPNRTQAQNEAMLGVNRSMGTLQVGANGEMSFTEGDTDTVNTHRDTAGLPVEQTLRSPLGRQVSVQDALKNPTGTFVTIGGMETDLQSAINAGLVEVKGNSIASVTQPEPTQSTQKAQSFISGKVAQYVNTCRSMGQFDAALDRVLGNSGKPSSDNKVREALTNYAHETGADSVEDARRNVNAVIENVTENAKAAISAQFGRDTAEGAIDWLMAETDHTVRASLFRGLLYGDRNAVFQIIENYQLRNRF